MAALGLLFMGIGPAMADVVSFPATPTVDLETVSQSVAAGDLDGDFDIDLVVSPNFGTARYFLNDGTSTPFTGAGIPLDTTRTANEVALGDMNGDGRLDIVVGSFNGVEHLYLNNGTTTPFHQVVPTDIGSGLADSTYDVYPVDLDGDGDLDVVTANTNQNGNKIYFNNGTSAPFAGVPVVFVSSDRLYSEAMAFGDLEADGDVDIVVANADGLPNDPGIQVFLNNGTATPFVGVAGQVLTTTGAGSVALGDADGDADLDIVAGTYGTAALLVLNNGTNAPFTAPQTQNVADVGKVVWRQVVKLTDMNGDTRLDLLASTFESTMTTSTSQYFVVLNNGSAQPFADRAGITIGAPRLNYSVGRSFAIADFDGDTDRDVLIGDMGNSDQLFAATIGPDLVPPQLTILSPAANATLRGTVAVTATAIDDDGLDSVNFQVLSLNLGRRMAPPFEVQFDTTLVPNGLQSISAVARDRSGNEKLVSVIVTVANPINQTPTVGAGPDATVASPTTAITLTGTATDDGLPAGGTLTTTWSLVSGPGTATFTSGSALSTQVNVSAAGSYVFRLTANDGAASATDDVAITVSPAPGASSGGGGGGALGLVELLIALALLAQRSAARRRAGAR